MTHLVAVYGTLRRGYTNHYLLETSKLIGYYHTGPGYRKILQGLPFLLEDSSGDGCPVEIYEVNDKILDLLDLLEGHPDWYERKQITFYEGKNRIKAWIYLMSPDRI